MKTKTQYIISKEEVIEIIRQKLGFDFEDNEIEFVIKDETDTITTTTQNILSYRKVFDGVIITK